MRTDFPRQAADYKELAELIARIFAGRYTQLHSQFVLDAHGDPKTRPEFWRILRRGGKIVAHVGIYEKPMRIGRAVLRMGGIGFVCCDERFRRHGLAATCMKDAQAVMRSAGMPLSFLFGVDRYYGRFGFVGCLPNNTLRLAVREIPTPAHPFTVSPLRLADVPEMLRLYAAGAAGTPGAIERDRAALLYDLERWNLKPTRRKPQESVLLFREKPDAPARAYAVWRDGTAAETMLAPGDDAAAAAVLAELRDRRKANQEREVVLGDGHGPAHPLWAYARRFNHTAETSFSWTGRGMGCILNVKTFLEQIQPELEARVNATGIDGECQLHLHVDGATHTLVLGRGHAFAMAGQRVLEARVTCTQQSLLQMVLGSLPYSQIPGVKVEGEPALVRAVFPPAHPAIYRLDAF